MKDDGQGPTGAGRGYGLQGIRERTEMHGGRVHHLGPAPGGGFEVAVELPGRYGTEGFVVQEFAPLPDFPGVDGPHHPVLGTWVVDGEAAVPPQPPAPYPEVPERARGPRRYSAKYKARILEEYEGLNKAGKGALLRREGLYTSLISEWRKQRDKGAPSAPLSCYEMLERKTWGIRTAPGGTSSRTFPPSGGGGISA